MPCATAGGSLDSASDMETHDGALDSPLSCPLSCGATQYCRFIFEHGDDGGCATPSQRPGGWACVDLPSSCEGAPTCACIYCGCCTQVSARSFACQGA